MKKTKEIQSVFNKYPASFRRKINTLRDLIFKTVTTLPEIEGIEESLKWGQPSYQSVKKGLSTPIRLHWLKSKPDQIGIYFHCQSSMIKKIKKEFPGKFEIEGKRALIFKESAPLELADLEKIFILALTYHNWKR